MGTLKKMPQWYLQYAHFWRCIGNRAGDRRTSIRGPDGGTSARGLAGKSCVGSRSNPAAVAREKCSSINDVNRFTNEARPLGNRIDSGPIRKHRPCHRESRENIRGVNEQFTVNGICIRSRRRWQFRGGSKPESGNCVISVTAGGVRRVRRTRAYVRVTKGDRPAIFMGSCMKGHGRDNDAVLDHRALRVSFHRRDAVKALLWGVTR